MTANFEAITSKADANGIIHGVSVITIGEAKGHGLWVDETSLAQFEALAAEHPNGVKVKSKHGTNFDAIVGALKNFRRDSAKLLADLHLIKSHPQFSHIIELSEKMPGEFGLSASCKYSAEEKGGRKIIRPTELSSVDLVDDPAANPDGLFSAPIVERFEGGIVRYFPFLKGARVEPDPHHKVDTNQSTDMQTADADNKSILESIKGFFSKAESGLVPVAQFSAVQTEATNLKAELQTVSTKNGELSAQLEVKTREVETLKATHKAELEAKENDVEKRASAKALELAAQQGIKVGTVKADKAKDAPKTLTEKVLANKSQI